ncbi:hypothetical protein ACKKBG_A20810 [Auxenochlorella protothecoides x Auxenochlorella symbiontica]
MAEACLATELEALSATFEGVVWDSQQRSVRVSILPYTDADVFLTCTLVLDLTDYPAAGVNVLLEGVKGFSDSQELQLVEALRGLVQDGGDEAGLLPLVASALDQVTEWNRPSGTCVLCLEALDDVPAAQACLLPCLHCFHRTCFLSYAAWQQDRLARRAEEIAEQWKAAAPAQLAKEGVAADAATGAYAMPCPCCRAVVAPAQLPPGFAARARGAPAPAAAAAEPPAALASLLDGPTLQALRRLQRTQRATLEAQRRAGGLVGTRVAVTLAELEASRQAARDTASAAVAEPREVRQVGSEAGCRGRGLRHGCRERQAETCAQPPAGGRGGHARRAAPSPASQGRAAGSHASPSAKGGGGGGAPGGPRAGAAVASGPRQANREAPSLAPSASGRGRGRAQDSRGRGRGRDSCGGGRGAVRGEAVRVKERENTATGTPPPAAARALQARS